MVHVQPGDATGLYYIIIAGLPWNCSWKRLKDVCRNQQADGTCIDIDHAHVYPEETNGWVRVKGKQNFLKIMEHLKTAVIDHRCLVVDGRNETQITNIKPGGILGFGLMPRRARNDSSSSCDTCPSSTASYDSYQNTSPSLVYSGSEEWYGQRQPGLNASPMSPTSPGASNYQDLPQMFNPISPYASSEYFQPIPSSVVCAGNMAPTTPIYVTPIPQQPVYIYTMPVPYLETPLSLPVNTSVITTEARKIIITQLPRSISYHKLKQLLSKHITRNMPRYSLERPYNELLELNIMTSPNKKPCVYAFAVLGSEQIAISLIKSLDGLRFQNRVLKARFAKEGVESSERYFPAADLMSPPTDSHYHTLKTTQDSPPRGEREFLVDSAPAPITAESLAQDDSKCKREYQDGSRDHERREGSKKKNASPLVVNGSSSDGEGKLKKYHSL